MLKQVVIAIIDTPEDVEGYERTRYANNHKDEIVIHSVYSLEAPPCVDEATATQRAEEGLEELKKLAFESHQERLSRGGMATASVCVCGAAMGDPSGTPLCALLADYLDRRYPQFHGNFPLSR